MLPSHPHPSPIYADDFVCVCGIYCMYGKDEILQILFDLFDQDGSGAIDDDEFQDLCKMVNNGNPTFPGNFQAALETFDTYVPACG